MLLEINWRCALRYPLSRVRVLLGGRRVTGSAIALQVLLAARSGIPRSMAVSPERAASALRVAFALQVLLAARSGVPCLACLSSWEAAALLVPPSRHSWLHGYLLLLLAPRRPRL